MSKNAGKYVLGAVAIDNDREKGFVFNSDCSGIMTRLIAQAHSENLEIIMLPDNAVFIHTEDISKENAQSFIDDWFNPDVVVLSYLP